MTPYLWAASRARGDRNSYATFGRTVWMHRPAASIPLVYSSLWVLLIRGVLRIAQRRWADAVEELTECGRRALAFDHVSPSTCPWRSLLAIALAAAGQQNREIAETLFVTTATVEYHLRNAYRKLGIGSRTQLAGALA